MRMLVWECLLGVALLSAAVWAQHPESTAPPVENDAPKGHLNQDALEKEFQEALSGAILIGHFTADDQPRGAAPQEERYAIRKLTKLGNDYWLFLTEISFGKKKVTLPLPLRVLWAGDTPVITVDKVPVPGLGTYTARVLIYDNQYAGTWTGAEHGGHLFGRIEKQKPGQATTKTDEKNEVKSPN